MLANAYCLKETELLQEGKKVTLAPRTSQPVRDFDLSFPSCSWAVSGFGGYSTIITSNHSIFQGCPDGTHWLLLFLPPECPLLTTWPNPSTSLGILPWRPQPRTCLPLLNLPLHPKTLYFYSNDYVLSSMGRDKVVPMEGASDWTWNAISEGWLNGIWRAIVHAGEGKHSYHSSQGCFRD